MESNISSSQPVFLLSYDHGGYILWGPHFEERLESAIEWLDKYPKFKIGLDNEAFAYDKYAEINPDVIKRIQSILREYDGRFAIGSCTYGQPLSVFINEESNVRQLVYAIRTNLKYFGVTPNIYAISEHALHSQIPQLIAQTGYEGAVMRTHFMMYGYNPTYNEAYGWWVGDDGTKIPTVPTYDGQGAQFAITTFDNWILTRWPDETDRSLEDFAEKFGHIKPLLASRYDDITLRCEKLVEHVEQNDVYQWALLEDIPKIYKDAQMAEFKPSANEFKVRMPWGYCGNKIFNDCRRAEIAVGTAERLNAAAVLAGGREMQAQLEEAWKNLLLAQHHDIQICGLLKDADTYLPSSVKLSQDVINESMEYISSLFISKHECNLIVFNPLSWRAKQKVTTEVALPRGKGTNGFKVVFKGQDIPCEVLALDKRQDKITRAKISFTAEVEPLAANCYSVIPTDEVIASKGTVRYDTETGLLKTLNYEIRLCDQGIAYIKDSQNGKVYVNNVAGTLFEGIINDEAFASLGRWIVHCYENHVTAHHLGEIGGIGFEFEMVVSSLTKRIDCKVTFDHHGEKIGSAGTFDVFADNTNGFVHEDKLRFILSPSTSAKASGVRDLPFLISETPDKYIQGNYWTALTDGNIGLAYFNKGAMCSVREEDGFSIPLEYANEYVWGSRYLYGKYSHEFAIYPFEGSWQEADLHKEALEYEYPFVTCRTEQSMNHDGQTHAFKDTVSFILVAAEDNVILSSIYPEDGDIIARFYDYKGQEGRLSVTSEFAKIMDEVDLTGKHISDIDGGTVTLVEHGIKSIRLVCQSRTK